MFLPMRHLLFPSRVMYMKARVVITDVFDLPTILDKSVTLRVAKVSLELLKLFLRFCIRHFRLKVVCLCKNDILDQLLPEDADKTTVEESYKLQKSDILVVLPRNTNHCFIIYVASVENMYEIIPADDELITIIERFIEHIKEMYGKDSPLFREALELEEE